MYSMQETTYSKETISEEIKMYEEFIGQWKQELTELQEELQRSNERISLLKELKLRIPEGSGTYITNGNITALKSEVAELTRKEVNLNGNIKTYSDFVDELNKML